MFIPLFQHTIRIAAVVLLTVGAGAIDAQEANVLGLPAIPQPKPGSPATATNTVNNKAAATELMSRDIFAGQLGIQHSALNGIGRMLITTVKTFPTPAASSQALAVARVVQRELSLSCGKQCKPQTMTAPKILPTGQLQFDLVFRPLHQFLTQAQMLAAVQGQALNLTAAQLTAPAPAAAPAAPTAPAKTTATQ
jgi:hypothetical protein